MLKCASQVLTFYSYIPTPHPEACVCAWTPTTKYANVQHSRTRGQGDCLFGAATFINNHGSTRSRRCWSMMAGGYCNYSHETKSTSHVRDNRTCTLQPLSSPVIPALRTSPMKVNVLQRFLLLCSSVNSKTDFGSESWRNSEGLRGITDPRHPSCRPKWSAS